nr:putative DNA-binding domain-containing protein [Pseudoteredinibacter isoporae]
MFVNEERQAQKRLLNAIVSSEYVHRLSSDWCSSKTLAPKRICEFEARGVYRNNYQGALRRSLLHSFPVASRHMPAEAFGVLVNEYLVCSLGNKANIDFFPSDFASFVASKMACMENSWGLPTYLGDLLRLEWAVDCATRGAIQAERRLTPKKLQRLSVSGGILNARFSFNKSLQILKLPEGLIELWRIMKSLSQPVDSVLLSRSPRQVLHSLYPDDYVHEGGPVAHELEQYCSIQIAIGDSGKGAPGSERLALSIDPVHPLLYSVLDSLPHRFSLEQLSVLCEDVLTNSEAVTDAGEFLVSVLSQTAEQKYFCVDADEIEPFRRNTSSDR